MSHALTTLLSSDTCIRFGEIVSQDSLRELVPTRSGKDVTDRATLREFVDNHFYPTFKVKLPMFGQSHGKDNGSELSKLTRELGFNVGKKEVAYFDKKLGGFVADWVNCYPLEVLFEWVFARTEGEYDMRETSVN